MKAIRVNVDFEEVLSGRPPRPSLLTTVEFFALWVSVRPLLAHRPYSNEYLDYVQCQTGHKAQIVTNGEAEDWWGDTTQPELMRLLSSKTHFLDWWQGRWSLRARHCRSWNDLVACIGSGTWLIKKSDGMSGRGHTRVTSSELPILRDRIEKSLADGVVVEPLYQRVGDVSALWIPEEQKFIFYTNFIDARFQWRGTLLRRDQLDAVPAGTSDWKKQLSELQHYVAELGYDGPFSVDAFFYEHEGETLFHPGSEMNPRKTMGWLAYQLWRKNHAAFATLQLTPCVLDESSWQGLKTNTDATILSPEGNQFVWYWIEANSEEELRHKQDRFLTALPVGQVRDKV